MSSVRAAPVRVDHSRSAMLYSPASLRPLTIVTIAMTVV